MSMSLEEAIARVPHWAGALDLRVERLKGGITNKNYKISVNGESFVLRLAGAGTHLLGIDREHEYAAALSAAAAGIGPEVLCFIRPEGCLVTRFVEGVPLPSDEMRRAENIPSIAGALHRIHGMPRIPGAFSPFRTVENYAQTAQKYGVSFPPSFDRLMERMHEIEIAFLTSPVAPHPCHNDLVNENLLDDGGIRILDWEYAGMGDIFFDLANFCANQCFHEDHEELLLRSYFGDVRPYQRARLKLMKIMSDFREAMWGQVQCGISDLDFDFRGYADRHFRRLADNLKDSRWERWLREAAGNG